jgi:hypothetical protein
MQVDGDARIELERPIQPRRGPAAGDLLTPPLERLERTLLSMQTSIVGTVVPNRALQLVQHNSRIAELPTRPSPSLAGQHASRTPRGRGCDPPRRLIPHRPIRPRHRCVPSMPLPRVRSRPRGQSCGARNVAVAMPMLMARKVLPGRAGYPGQGWCTSYGVLWCLSGMRGAGSSSRI